MWVETRGSFLSRTISRLGRGCAAGEVEGVMETGLACKWGQGWRDAQFCTFRLIFWPFPLCQVVREGAAMDWPSQMTGSGHWWKRGFEFKAQFGLMGSGRRVVVPTGLDGCWKKQGQERWYKPHQKTPWTPQLQG